MIWLTIPSTPKFSFCQVKICQLEHVIRRAHVLGRLELEHSSCPTSVVVITGCQQLLHRLSEEWAKGNPLQTPLDHNYPHFKLFPWKDGNFQFLHSVLINKLITWGSLYYWHTRRGEQCNVIVSLFKKKKSSSNYTHAQSCLLVQGNCCFKSKQCQMGSEEISDPTCWRQHLGFSLLAPHVLKWD